MARPLWAVGFTWLAVLAAAALLPLNVTVLLAALCALLFVATLFISPLRKKRALPVVILAAGIAFSLYAVREVFVYRPCVRLDGRTVPGGSAGDRDVHKRRGRPAGCWRGAKSPKGSG